MQQRSSLLGQSALSAYRADLPLGGGEAVESDGAALLVATMLRHATSATDNKRNRDHIVRNAEKLARSTLSRPSLQRGCAYDDGPAKKTIDVFRLLAEECEQRGNVKVCGHILETLSELAPDGLAGGRILADRSRNSRKQGLLDLASEQSRELLRRTRATSSDELRARAWIGLCAVAQSRGNFQEMRRAAANCIRIAERQDNLRRLAAAGHGGLGIAAAMSGDLQRAVVQLWKGYQESTGDRRAQLELLTNLAQVLLLAGHAQESRAAASGVLRAQPPLRLALPALGAFALASAGIGRMQDVDWAAKQALALAKSRGHVREAAGAMIECATALAVMGAEQRAGVLRRRSELLATKHGFFDLTFREALAASPATLEPQRFSRSAAAAAVGVGKLESHVLPSDLDLAGVW